MAMTRRYSRVTHQPAALFYSAKGKLLLLMVGPPMGIFIGQRLPDRATTGIFGVVGPDIGGPDIGRDPPTRTDPDKD